jgi:hypothetical protein
MRILVWSTSGYSRLQHLPESLCAGFDAPLHLVGTAPNLVGQVLDADTEVLELDAIPERVEPASIEACEPSSWGSEVEDLLEDMGAKGDVDLWVSAPEIDLMWRLAVKTKEELRSELEISGSDAEVLGTAARAHTGVVPTVVDEIVATTGASKQEVLEHFITEAGSGATPSDMRDALRERFEATM